MSCELCGKQGTIKCPHCASFYCSMAHRDLDKSIHSSICSKLSVARETSTSPEIARQMKVEIIQIAREKAKEYLELRESELVIPSALQFLRFSSELDRDSLDCIEANLMLVEASLGLKRYGEVQEFLSRANWSILKAGESCPSSLRAQLHHHFGKLYASLGRIEDSTQNLALSVYFSSLEEGPASVGIGQSLFHMAEIFYSQNKVEHALAFFDKVVDIWYKFLNASKDGNEIKIPTKRELEDAKGMLMRILLYFFFYFSFFSGRVERTSLG
eukprot:TRINITY_DN3116_c0_g1_i1.p1 TRINITY_DN3116_c0_g1~~TRINITY_DN3116_c0_g1_i1.p1  ORF type:complete len:271 (+),score=34.21 TRINITY_DN3116_c0_g1_i1:162-974(+)